MLANEPDLVYSYRDNISQCEKIIAYTFTRKILLVEALNAGGERRHNGMMIRRNDKLAVYGDAAACMQLCREWFEAGQDKATWTTVFKAVLGNLALNVSGQDVGFANLILMNEGHRKEEGISPKVMATTVEAILGAVYIDGGEIALGRVMEHMGLTLEVGMTKLGERRN